MMRKKIIDLSKMIKRFSIGTDNFCDMSVSETCAKSP